MADTPRRLVLRVTLKLLTLVAVAAVAITLLYGGEERDDSKPGLTLQLSLNSLPVGTPQRVVWQEGPLQLLRTTTDVLYIFYDRGGHLGCPLSWQPPGHRNAPERPWGGGFRDQCSGTWYRIDGSVLPAQATNLPLTSPSYLRDGDLLQIGVSGDNAAPDQ
ncbi:MAG: hypothetical protein OEZ16_10180 [Chromatiales bacterium]|nr:hypothetical protein [Chromatiales bacterium]